MSSVIGERTNSGRETDDLGLCRPGAADLLREQDAAVASALASEAQRQQDTIELIASENYVSPLVLAAQGSVLTNKYAEGYPGQRYYGGCRYVDVVERLAIELSLIHI